MKVHRGDRFLQGLRLAFTRAQPTIVPAQGPICSRTRAEHLFGCSLLVIALITMPFFGKPTAAEPALSRQVLIEANIWEINEQANIDYGIIWDLIDLDEEVNDLLDSSIFLPGLFTERSQQTAGHIGAAVQTTLDIYRDRAAGEVLVAQLNTQLQAASRNGTVHLRANPKVVVVENQTAVIHAGDRFPVVELTVSRQGLPTLKTTYHDTGVKLTVWPRIYRDEFVILSVRPEVTDITSFVEQDVPPAVAGEDPQLFRLPVLSTRDAYSQMIVRTGGTVIMSGLLLESQREVIREVPIVSKIPLLGWLFRSRNWTRQKNDILVEITPTILQAGESRYTPNGLIYEGEIFTSDSDIVRQLRKAESMPPEEVAPPPGAGDWFGVAPEEGPEQETPSEPAPTEEALPETPPDAAGAETGEATPETAAG